MADMVAALKGKTGDAIDEAFLATMIPHHAGGVAMARQVVASGAHPQLKQLCRHIVTDQSAEIAEMRRFQAAWGFAVSPADLANDNRRIVDMAVKTPPAERAAGRRKLAAKGQALPAAPGGEPSFPIPDLNYLKRAIRSVGRAPASKRPALAALIRKRARQLKATNAPGVKGTWAFQGTAKTMTAEAAALEFAATAFARRLPIVRGAADIQAARTAPQAVTIRHKSTGMKVGTIVPAAAGTGYQGVHADGTRTAKAPTVAAAVTGLVAYHNRQASRRLPPAQQGGVASYPGSTAPKVRAYTGGVQEMLDLSGALPHASAVSVTDGPRITTAGGAGKPKAAPAGAMTAEARLVYAKLLKKGLSPKAALAMAKRAAAMHAKAAAA